MNNKNGENYKVSEAGIKNYRKEKQMKKYL